MPLAPLTKYPTFGRLASWDEWKDATATHLPDLLWPWFISNSVGFALLWISLLDERSGTQVARRSWGALMVTAGVVNSFFLWTDPKVYIEFGVLAIPTLQRFIYSKYFLNPTYLVGPIIICQWAIGIIMLQRNPKPAILRMALFGAIIWFLGITPLGLGSAFPSSLVYASTMLVCLKQFPNRHRHNEHMVSKGVAEERSHLSGKDREHAAICFTKGLERNKYKTS
jgi:hypothetical protein